MEPVGLVVGVLALVGVFEDCITLLSQVATAKAMEQDYTRLETKLDFQKVFLLQWAARLNLFNERYDKRLDNPDINSLVARGLYCIRDLFLNSDELQRRYGCRHVEENEETSSFSAVSDRLMAHYQEHLVALRSRQSKILSDSRTMRAKTSKHSNFTKIKWVARDKEKFENLVRELSDLVTSLEKILPVQEGDKSSRTVLKDEIHRLHDISVLKIIVHASADENIDLIEAAEDAITQKRYTMILNQLWFRLIDDRKNSIAKKHPKTLKWAINPPSGKRTWDDLSEWFRQGNDIYWISGKPGSGKSTLMKYLLEHPDVISMLKQWAGDLELTVASFFLWNIGSVEQNSQQGLARGLLYHVLQQNKSLIPIALPGMWKEAQNGNTQLNLPSESEMKEAFQKLGKESKSGAYAFFIDGIDEFAGNYREGISFIKNLAESSNIKLLVSSRPIYACEAAFASKPKLALQDHTEHDIDVYITHTLRSQPYVIEKEIEEDTVSRMIGDLKKKAEGVFLWVVLACRTLVDGFQAYDSLEELQRRVEELPVELEDLFRHILGKIPPRFLSHTAKLLRICWTSRQTPELPFLKIWVSALGLTIVDEQNFKNDAFRSFTECSLDEKRRKISRLKGRLTSRCMGLLEIHGISRGINTLDDNQIDQLSVEFMHRTVFEFLSKPGVWDIASLDFHDQDFDAMNMLSCISAHALYLQARPIILDGKRHDEIVGELDGELISQNFDYLNFLNDSASINFPSAVKSFTSAFIQSCWVMRCDQQSGSIVDPHRDMTNENSRDSSRSAFRIDTTSSNQRLDYVSQSLPLDYATLLIAISFNLNSYISKREIIAFKEARTQFLHPFLQYPLLYHALKHLLVIQSPILWEHYGGLVNIGYELLPPVRAIRELLKYGCNPNETFADSEGEITTPFREWIKAYVYEGDLNLNEIEQGFGLEWAEIVLMMLEASANFEPPNCESVILSKAGDWKATLMCSTDVWLRASTEMYEEDETRRTKLVEYCNKIRQAISEDN